MQRGSLFLAAEGLAAEDKEIGVADPYRRNETVAGSVSMAAGFHGAEGVLQEIDQFVALWDVDMRHDRLNHCGCSPLQFSAETRSKTFIRKNSQCAGDVHQAGERWIGRTRRGCAGKHDVDNLIELVSAVRHRGPPFEPADSRWP